MIEKLKTVKDPTLPILIVDDNVQYAQVLKRILEKIFAYQNVSIVNSPTVAYQEISINPGRYRILFIDYNFPEEETGGSLLRRLRNGGLLEGKIAFLITSDPNADNLKEAQQNGAMGVVAKPFDRNDLQKQFDKAQRALEAGAVESF